MNPFNPLSIVQSTFESADVQHELKELVEIIRAYDIYDFLRRLSALNLQKENQNRAVLLDALQSAILYNDETYYTSSAKMSAGKFSSIIKKMDSISLVHAIDPNENVFTQNVMLYDNYTVFNGIDSYPAYRLQMLCEIFFGFKNSFPLEYMPFQFGWILTKPFNAPCWITTISCTPHFLLLDATRCAARAISGETIAS